MITQKIRLFFRKKIDRINRHRKSVLNLRATEETLWAQIFNNAINNSAWFKVQALNPGRWAMGYPGLYIIYRILNDIKPQNVLEFGLGESTKLTFQYVDSQADKSLTIVEQDRNWIEFFSSQIFDVQSYTIVLPIEKRLVLGRESNTYTNLIPNIRDKKYNFIIVDGPWGSLEYSRYQIVDIIEADLLADDFVILMDDYNRIGEKQTMKKVKALLDRKGIEYNEGLYSGVKDVSIICSVKYQFLTTL